MKKIAFQILFLLCFLEKNKAQILVFQDTTFAQPLVLTNVPGYVKFENCGFLGITGQAALTLINTNADIQHCQFENIDGTGIWAIGSTVICKNDSLRNISGTGFIGSDCQFLQFSNCLFERVSERALSFSKCDTAQVFASTITDVGAGIRSVETDLTIAGCNIRRINGVLGEDESADGIRADNIKPLAIRQNVVDSCMASGICLGKFGAAAATGFLQIEGNRISRTNLDGIGSQENVHNAHILNNDISFAGFLGGRPQNGDHGIYWQGPDALIEGNHIHHIVDTACNQNYCGTGISIRTSATLNRNHIHDCTGNGIQYFNDHPAGSADLQILNNIIYDVAGNPILYHGGTSGGIEPSEPIQTLVRNNTLLGVFQDNYIRNAPLSVCCNDDQVWAQGNILMFQNVPDTLAFIQTYFNGTISENMNLKMSVPEGFVDYVGRDFHLSSSDAPAFNFLPFNLGAPYEDFDGEPRDNLHDAGADELLSDTMSTVEKNLESKGWHIELSPNPNDGAFSLTIASHENLPASIALWNGLGEKVFDQKISVSAGKNLLPLDLRWMPNGFYYLEIHTFIGNKALRVMIVH